MSKSNKYGYSGVDIPTQAFRANVGKFDPSEINELVQEDKWTTFGQLELIQTQTISSGSTLAFTNIKQNIYNVHFATLNNIESSSSSTAVNIRFSNDGGSSYEAGTNYQRAAQYGGSVGNGESKSTGTSAISILPDSANQNKGGYCYFYNLGDSTKYSFVTFHGIEQDYYRFGSGVYDTAETIDAIQFLTTNSNAWTGTISLYGIRFA